MKHFDYFTPTKITFDASRVAEAGALAARYGRRAMLATIPEFPAVAELYTKTKKSLADAGVVCIHYDGVILSPTTKLVTRGAELTKAEGMDVVIGLGGGSSMDTARAIAVKVIRPGTTWDYNCHIADLAEQTLPILIISMTTSTGSQTAPCAAITKTGTEDKSAIWSKNTFPHAAIVDPEVTLSPFANAAVQTGFGVFCHNLEIYLSVSTNPLVERMALGVIRIIAAYLPRALADSSDLEARSQMAWADTLGSPTSTSVSITLPHGLDVQIGGYCPHITHGQSLAVFYPAFTRCIYPTVEHRFTTISQILESSLERESDVATAERGCDATDYFFKRIGLWINFQELDVIKKGIRGIADYGRILGDYANNPRVTTIPEMYESLMSCYDRKWGRGGIMTETSILSRDIAAELARMGYIDWLLTTDAGLATPDNTRITDLSLAENIPTAVDVFKELFKHFSMEGITLNQTTPDASPSREREFKACFPPELPCQVVGHSCFRDELTRQVKSAIRTGGFTINSNIIFVSTGGPRWHCEKS